MHHLPVGCVLSVQFCLLSLRCHLQSYVVVTLHLTVCLCAIPPSLCHATVLQTLKKKKKNETLFFKSFSTSQLLFLQLFMIPSQVSFCLVDDCPLVVTSTKRPVLESILQLQVINVTCIQRHFTSAPFLWTSLVSSLPSVRCRRLHYQPAVMETFLKPLL